MRSVRKTVWGTVFSDARVGRVGRQIQDPATAISEGLCGAGIPVGAEVVENDHGPRLKDRGKLGRDIGGESVSVRSDRSAAG